MSTFFGFKVLMVAVLAIPVVALVTFALISGSDEAYAGRAMVYTVLG